MTIAARLTAARTILGVVVAALSWLPTPAGAQVTLDPTRAQFDPSPDHDASNADGTPVVQSYQIQFYLVGAAQPFQTVDLGKPTVDSSNTITVNLASALIGWPVAGTDYVAAIAAVGPGGVAASALSNPFAFSITPCIYSLSSTSRSVPAAGTSGSTTVTTSSECTWTVMSGASWITVSGAGSRTGSGTVTYTVAANAGTARTGTLTVAGQVVTVSQAGACGFALSSSSQSVAASGGSGSTSVTTTSGCTWTVRSNASWITISGNTNRTGSGTVNFTVSANTSANPRTGTITVAGGTFTVNQLSVGSAPLPPANVRIAP